MNAAEPKLKKLAKMELEAANRENPPFHSAHEGYAVILEEVDEVCVALYCVRNAMMRIWDGVKLNNADRQMQNAKIVEKHAIHLAAEAIQVAAMAKKFQQLGGENDDA